MRAELVLLFKEIKMNERERECTFVYTESRVKREELRWRREEYTTNHITIKISIIKIIINGLVLALR